MEAARPLEAVQDQRESNPAHVLRVEEAAEAHHRHIVLEHTAAAVAATEAEEEAKLKEEPPQEGQPPNQFPPLTFFATIHIGPEPLPLLTRAAFAALPPGQEN